MGRSNTSSDGFTDAVVESLIQDLEDEKRKNQKGIQELQ
jgi:hypothetical protein